MNARSKSRASWLLIVFTLLIVLYVFTYANASLLESPNYTTTVVNTTTVYSNTTTTITTTITETTTEIIYSCPSRFQPQNRQ